MNENEAPQPVETDSTKWWIALDGKSYGPHTGAHIELLLKQGNITATTVVCPVGGEHWLSLADRPEFAPYLKENDKKDLPPPPHPPRHIGPPPPPLPAVAEMAVLIDDQSMDSSLSPKATLGWLLWGGSIVGWILVCILRIPGDTMPLFTAMYSLIGIVALLATGAFLTWLYLDVETLRRTAGQYPPADKIRLNLTPVWGVPVALWIVWLMVGEIFEMGVGQVGRLFAAIPTLMLPLIHLLRDRQRVVSAILSHSGGNPLRWMRHKQGLSARGVVVALVLTWLPALLLALGLAVLAVMAIFAVISPGQPSAANDVYDRGVIHAKSGEFDKAIADFTEAIRLEPDNAEAYFNRGLAYDEQGQSAKAIADYTKAIRLRPDYARAYYNRGLAYGKQGLIANAITDFTEAIRLKPDNAAAYNNRGFAYGKQGLSAKAIADFTEAIRLNPNFAKAYNNRGNAFGERGAFAKAIADFTEAIRLKPDDGMVYFLRGAAYQKMGDKTKGEVDFAKAKALGFKP